MKKDRTNKGRYTPKIPKPSMKYSDIIEEAINPEIEWEEWNDYRDGMRFNPDRKQIRSVNMWHNNPEELIKSNNKNIKHEIIRKKRKKTRDIKYQGLNNL